MTFVIPNFNNENTTKFLQKMLTAFLLLLFPLTAHAGEETDNSKDEPEKLKQWELGEIEIIGEKKTDKNFQDLVPGMFMEGTGVSETVEGTLENLPGFDLERRSYSGNESSRLKIRGLDESRCRILLGGNPLHGAGVYGGYYVDWNSLDLQNIESIEIIRGLAPAKYGNTLGGVVNIVPRYGSKDPETTLDFKGGWLSGTGGLGVGSGTTCHSCSAGPIGWSLSAGRYETDGYLRNAFVDRDTFSAGLTWDFTKQLKLTFSGRYTKTKAGMIVYNSPDSPYYRSDYPVSLESQLGGPGLPFRNHGSGSWGPLDWGDGSYWRDQRLNLETRLSWKSDDFDFDLGAYFIDQDRSEHFKAVTDENREVFGRETEPEKNNWGWRADFENRLELLGRHSIEYGATGHYLGYGDIDVRNYDRSYFFGPPPPAAPHPNLLDSEGKATVSRHHGVYFQDRWEITDWLEVTPGIRYDDFRASGTAGTGRLVEKTWGPRIKVMVKPRDDCNFSAAYGRAYRFPTLPEYYWYYEGYQPPDRTDLAPESANQWELSAEIRVAENLSLKSRGYYYEIGDYIRTIFGYRPSRVVYNIDNVTLAGIELEARYDLPKNFFVWGNYTFQKSEKSGDILSAGGQLSDELVELPDHKFNIGIGYEEKDGLEARLSVRYVGKREAILGDLTTPDGAYLGSMNSFFDMDFDASYPVYSKDKMKARLGITVENLLDRHYEEEYGYPMPGLTATVNLRMMF